MNKLDVLIVNPGNQKQTYQSLSNTLTAFENPVWAGLMCSFVRQHGLNVQILDANAEKFTPAQVADCVDFVDPTLVVIVVYGHQPSASTQNMPSAGAIAAEIRSKNAKRTVLMIGGHVAALPEQTLLEEPVSYTAVGEGLHTIVDLWQYLTAVGPADITKVRGLVHFKDGAVHINEEPPLFQNVNDLLIPWADLPMHQYRAHNWHCFGGLERQPYAAIYTTLGCPFKCTFCCIQAPFKSGEKAANIEGRNSYRFWSPKVVGDQLQLLVDRYGVRNVKFADEMFVLNRRHVEGICDEIIARKLDLNIWAYARVDTVKSGMLPKLRAAGFRWLAFGVESGNAVVRDGVDKSFTQDEIMSVLDEVRANDINIGANYIFGLPDDNLDTMQQTLQLAQDVNAEYANFYSTMAYPGSPLYTQAVKEGWDLPKSWTGYSQHSEDCHPLPSKYLSSDEIVAFRDQAFVTYFSSQRYVDMMQKKFGDVAVAEIKQMLEHKLVRNAARQPA